MLLILCLLCLGLLHPSVERTVNSTSQIYDKLEKAIKSKDEKLCNELLDKHYFTSNPDEAIWNYALLETENLIKVNFSLPDHITMDKDIKAYKQLWKACKLTHRNTIGCNDIFDLLHDTMKDFHWRLKTGKFHRKNYIAIRTAYQSMVILMFSSMAESPWVETFKDVVEWYEKLEETYSEITKYLTDYSAKVKKDRPFHITVAEVCSMKRYMWRDFQEPKCEFRWNKNEIASDDQNRKSKRSFENNSKDEVKNDGDDDDEEKEKFTEEDEKFFKVFANPNMDSVMLLGGRSSEYDLILRSRYTDFGGELQFVTGQKEFSMRNISKAEMIEEMINLTIDQREVYVKDKVEEMDSYLKATFEKVMKASQIFVKSLRKKFSYWKAQVENRRVV